jgi:hypothetical protein
MGNESKNTSVNQIERKKEISNPKFVRGNFSHPRIRPTLQHLSTQRYQVRHELEQENQWQLLDKEHQRLVSIVKSQKES